MSANIVYAILVTSLATFLSRFLGALTSQGIKETSKNEGVSIEQVSAHKDSYLSNKFDFVITNYNSTKCTYWI